MEKFPVKAEGIVFRGLRNKNWRIGSRVSERAYIRRRASQGKEGDANGLSIAPTHVDAIFNIKPFGIASIHSDSIRALKNPDNQRCLDAEWDSPEHGNIINVPFYDAAMPDGKMKDDIEDLLDELARSSELVCDEDFERALTEKRARCGNTP